MNQEELQALLNSGDPADIDRALQYLDENKQDVDDEPDSSGGDQGAAAKLALTTETDVNAAPSATEEKAKGIASKNGEHVLPYEVLERERQEKAELKRQLDEHERRAAEADNAKQQAVAMQNKVALFQAQLEKAGIKPAQLAEEMTLTEEELAAMEDFGEVGEVAGKTARKVMFLQNQLEQLAKQFQAQPAAAVKQAPAAGGEAEVLASIRAAIAETEGLSDVMDNPALRDKAVAIDEELQASAAFKDKSHKERFAEVMKRMAPVILKQEQGTKPGKKAADKDELDPPMSLSGIAGATADVTAPLSKQLEGLSEAQIQLRMNSMSDAQRDQLLKEMEAYA